MYHRLQNLEYYALKNLTTRTIYCRQIGHSFNTLPQLVQVAMWPHSRKTHSIGASMQILHSSSVASFSTAIYIYTCNTSCMYMC